MRDLKQYAEWLGERGIDPLQATRAVLDAYKRHLEELGRAPATIARKLACLSGYYEYGVAEELLDRNPVAHLRRPRVSEESPHLGLSRQQARDLMSTAERAGPLEHLLIWILLMNGTRISETLALQVEDVSYELGHRTIRLRRKGDKVVRAPINEHVGAALDKLLKGRRAGYIFTVRNGRPISRTTAWRLVKRLAKEAGIETPLSPHGLRATAITAALDAGAPLHSVQDMASHADPRTTRRYDRGKNSLERHPTYRLEKYLTG